MANTANLQMPLVAQSQAQKHVTVNEALALLDSVAQLTLESVTTLSPPASPVEGAGYGVPIGATGDWSGADGSLAVFTNGGWRMIAPQAGWKAWIKDEGRVYFHDGTEWNADAVVSSPNGAGIGLQVLEFDHSVSSGVTNITSEVIPAYSVVFGVTGRIVQGIGGSLNAWTLGVADSTARYGSGLQTGTGDWAFGLTGQPVSYFEETPLVLSAQNGTFSSGQVRLAVHLMRLGLPRI